MLLHKDIINKLMQLTHKKNETSLIKTQWLQKQITKLSISDQITLSEIHVLNCIGRYPSLNVTCISDELSMTKGGISKICFRLEQKKFITRLPRSINKKETYFCLTAVGKKLWNFHRTFENKIEKKYLYILQKYKKADLIIIYKFLKNLVES